MNPELIKQFAEAGHKIMFQFNLKQQQFIYLGAAVEDILGITVAECLKAPELLLDLVHEDEKAALENRLETLQEKKAVQMSVRLRPENDKVRFLKIDAHISNDNDGNEVVTGIAEDVTGEAEYEIYLLEFGRKKNSVLSIVAHDLKTPIAHIQGAVNLLQHGREKEEDMVLKLFGIIDQACADSIRLISDVLQEEHLKAPDVYLKKDRLDVLFLLHRVLKPFIATDKLGHRFEIVCEEKKVIAELDELRFMQVMNNLIMNSVKFTPANGNITLHVSCTPQQLTIILSDSGIGIPEEMRDHIFKPHTSGRQGLRGEASSGVGLSIVKKLVELLGGTIRVEGPPTGVGTAFCLEFPVNNSQQ